MKKNYGQLSAKEFHSACNVVFFIMFFPIAIVIWVLSRKKNKKVKKVLSQGNKKEEARLVNNPQKLTKVIIIIVLLFFCIGMINNFYKKTIQNETIEEETIEEETIEEEKIEVSTIWNICSSVFQNDGGVSVISNERPPYKFYRAYFNNKNYVELSTKIKDEIIAKCSDKSFEPISSFITDSYQIVYIEFYHKEKDSFGYWKWNQKILLAIYTQNFPIDEDNVSLSIKRSTYDDACNFD